MKPCKIVTLFLIIFLGACNFAPKYQAPDVGTPEKFRSAVAEGESIANTQWWDLFNDKILKALINEALEKNIDLQIAVSKIAQARYELGISTGDLMPTVGAGAGGGHSGISAPGDMPSSSYNQYEVGGSLTWELDVWGRLRNLRESDRRDLLAQEYMRKATIISLIADVARIYLELRQLDLQLNLTDLGLETRKKSYELSKKRLEAGLSSAIDLNQADAELQGVRADKAKIENKVKQQENALSVILARPPGSIKRGKDLRDQVFPPEVPPGLPAELLTRRPDILAMEEQLQGAGARVGAARAAFMPKIELTLIGGSASDSLSNLLTAGAYTAGASAVTNIFEGGKKIYKLKLTKEQQNEILLRYQQTVLKAFQEVDDSLSSNVKLKEARDFLRKKVVAAGNVRKLAEQSYKAGQSSYLEVLDAQRTELQSEIELAETWAGHLVATVQLYKALGGGWSPELEVELQAKEEAKKQALEAKKKAEKKKKK